MHIFYFSENNSLKKIVFILHCREMERGMPYSVLLDESAFINRYNNKQIQLLKRKEIFLEVCIFYYRYIYLISVTMKTNIAVRI